MEPYAGYSPGTPKPQQAEAAPAALLTGTVAPRRQYCTFLLEDEIYGAETFPIQEVIIPPRIFSVPTAPPDLLGVVNLRGSLIPIMDLKLIVKQTPWRLTPEGRILIVKQGSLQAGFAVDSIQHVVEVGETDLSPFEIGADDHRGRYLIHLVRLPGNLFISLDLTKILTEHRIR